MGEKKNSFYGFREQGHDSKYQSFALEIVAGCQLRCGNCYREFGLDISPMPKEFVERMIREAKKMGFVEIVFIGGEPTLHPQLSEFIQLALKEGMIPIVCTNGAKLANLSYCQSLLQPEVVVVIHGLLALPVPAIEKHVQNNGYVNKLKQAYKNIEKIRTDKIQIVAEAVAIKLFMDYLVEFHAWCRGNDYAPFIEINRRGNDGVINGQSVSPEEVKSLFTRLQRWDQTYAPELADSLLTPPAYGNKCTMSITGLHVKNFGNGNYSKVYSCCAQSLSHGDLKKESLDEIIADPSIEVYKNQDEWIAGPCQKCSYYQICRGGCRGEATLTFGCPRASCPACWHIPEKVRLDPKIMMPSSCNGCVLQEISVCNPKR